MRVEAEHDEGRRDDGGKVQKHQIVVVHHLGEETRVNLGLLVPPKQGKKPDDGAGEPAQADDY